MEVLKRETKSLCNICAREIPAFVYVENGKVIMKKKCLVHGEFQSLVETDRYCYEKLAHMKETKNGSFETLVIPITYKCNLDCDFCYLPHREKNNLEVKKIKEVIESFQGKNIALSGGEPTLRRDDLLKIVRFISKINKRSTLVTNGLALDDINYLRDLKKAGLNRVFLSFDGFNSNVYGPTKNAEKILEKKLKALKNLEQEKIGTILSMTIYKGINESEIKNIFFFAVNNSSFIREFRIRTSAKIGKFNEQVEGYFISDLIKMFEDAINLERYSSLNKYQFVLRHSSAHTVDLMLHFYRMGKKVKILSLTKVINDFSFFLFRLLSTVLGEKYSKKFFLFSAESVWNRLFIKQMTVHFAYWPTIENIDLGELRGGTAHLYDEKALNFCHAIVLNKKL